MKTNEIVPTNIAYLLVMYTIKQILVGFLSLKDISAGISNTRIIYRVTGYTHTRETQRDTGEAYIHLEKK